MFLTFLTILKLIFSQFINYCFICIVFLFMVSFNNCGNPLIQTKELEPLELVGLRFVNNSDKEIGLLIFRFVRLTGNTKELFRPIALC